MTDASVTLSASAASGRRAAQTFGRYIIGRDVGDAVVALYLRAVDELGESDDDAALRFATKHPWSIGPLDAALALVNRGAPLRRRLLLMAAILEAQPQYCDDFLPRDRRPWYAVVIAGAILRNALHAAVGLLMLPLLR
ncbi:MAG TPA: hypothetical protein VNG31_05090 [Candidatus Baltobacteraceae bacterium]|nr:hypothetical protein [Candidatus Baltobacteraceae bacterium]